MLKKEDMLYVPQEDSYLLQKAVKANVKPGMTVLDIGTGSGIQALAALQAGAHVEAADIDPAANSAAVQESNIPFIKSDLFEKIEKKYDAILFNPPYLPEDKNEPADSALQTTGGKHGYEISVRFIQQLGDHLNADGFALLLISTLTGQEKVEAALNENLFNFEVVDEEKVPFENLLIYKITKNKLRKTAEGHGLSRITPFMHGKRGNIHIAQLDGKKVAMKSQRVTTTHTIEHEANILQQLEQYNFTPKVIFSGKGYFIYEFIEGPFFLQWLETESRPEIKQVLLTLYEQMFTLDSLGMNKEEMHHPYKHIVITDENKPILLDFERCRNSEKLHNVTQFTQYVVSLKEEFKKKGIDINSEKLIELVKAYSRTYQEKEFRELVGFLLG